MSVKMEPHKKSMRDVLAQLAKRNAAVLFGLILVLGMGLRVYDIAAESYWIDEMSTVIESQQSIREILTSGRFDQPPAYYLPFHGWVQVFGTGETSTRLFSALLGIGCIVLVFLTGRELFGKEVGLLSAFFLAISGFQIYYSQIARFYTTFEFLTLCSYLFFLFFLKDKKALTLTGYGVASLLMVFSHTFGVFILAAQIIFLILQWKMYKHLLLPWLAIQALVLLIFGTYFMILMFGGVGFSGEISSNIGGITAPSLKEPVHTIYRFLLPARSEYGHSLVINTYISAGIFFAAGMIFYLLWKGRPNLANELQWWGKELQGMGGVLLLAGCWLIFPILLPFLISLAIVPVYKEYYMISAAPAFYLLLAFGLHSIRKIAPPAITLGTLLILIVPGLIQYYIRDVNEQWSEAALYVEQNSRQGEVIVFAPNENIGIQQKAFEWYYRGSSPSCGIGERLPDAVVWDTLRACVAGHPYFWVIIRGTTEDSPHIRYQAFFLDPNQKVMRLLQESHFTGIELYLFEWIE